MMNKTYPNPYLSGFYELRLNTVLTTLNYLGGTDLRGGNQVQGEGQQFNEDDPSSGLSDNELELMQALDKADNMLNSGSFSDFDSLIGTSMLSRVYGI